MRVSVSFAARFRRLHSDFSLFNLGVKLQFVNMLWPCRTILFLLICAAFFPRSRTDDTENDNTSDDQNDDKTNIDNENTSNENEKTEGKDEDETPAPTPDSSTTETDETTTSTSKPEKGEDQRLACFGDAYCVRDDENQDEICLAIELEGNFEIFYPFNGNNLTIGSKDVKTYDEDDDKFEGDCNVNDSTVSVTSHQWEGFNFTIYVTKDETAESAKWRVKNVELKFNGSKIWNNPNVSTVILVGHEEALSTVFNAPVGQSLSCGSKAIELYAQDGTPAAIIVINSIKLQAFEVTDKEFGTENACGSLDPLKQLKRKSYQSDTAPIAVGSTLAILTLGVIAGYAIYRSLTNKKPDYGNIGGE